VARGPPAGMMVAVFVLMIVGVILATIVRHIQAYLLRWRPASTMAT
jgi:NitT/TauT family transport system permease protein